MLTFTNKKLKHYAENIFVKNGSWHRRRKQKGFDVIEKVIYKKALIVKNHIIPMWGDIAVNKISAKMVDQDLCELDFAGATKNEILVCLKDIYQHLISEDIITENPVKNITGFSKEPVNPRGALSPADIEKLFPKNYDSLLRIWGSEFYACAFLIFLDTGLRPGELRALQWQDWYYEQKVFPITKAIESGMRNKIKQTKTGIVRPAIVTDFTADYIEYFRGKTKYNKPTDFIFAVSNLNPVKNEIISKNLHATLKRVGIDRPEVTTYWFRHTRNTRMCETMPDDIVRKLMGHTSEVMTRHYRDADIDSLLREAEKISEFLPKEEIKNENIWQMELAFA